MNNYLKLACALAAGLLLFYLIRLSSCGNTSAELTALRQAQKEWMRTRDSLSQQVVFSSRRIASLEDSITKQSKETDRWMKAAADASGRADALARSRQSIRVTPVSSDASEFVALIDSQNVSLPASIQADTGMRTVQGRHISVAMYLIRQGAVLKQENKELRSSVASASFAALSAKKELSLLRKVDAEKDAKLVSMQGVIDADGKLIKEQAHTLAKVVRKKNGAIIGCSIGGLVVGVAVGAVVWAVVTR